MEETVLADVFGYYYYTEQMNTCRMNSVLLITYYYTAVLQCIPSLILFISDSALNPANTTLHQEQGKQEDM